MRSNKRRKVTMQTQIFDMLMNGEVLESTNSKLKHQSLTNIINRITMKDVRVSNDDQGNFWIHPLEMKRIKKEGINV